MQQQRHALEELGVSVVVVTFEPAAHARRYVSDGELPWPLLVDETRDLYRAYGMRAGRFWDIWGPPSWWAYAKELARGRLPAPTRADIMQLGGDVLIDPEGIVRFLYVGRGPADRPSIATLLAARRSSSHADP